MSLFVVCCPVLAVVVMLLMLLFLMFSSLLMLLLMLSLLLLLLADRVPHLPLPHPSSLCLPPRQPLVGLGAVAAVGTLAAQAGHVCVD